MKTSTIDPTREELQPNGFSEHRVVETHFRRRGEPGTMFDVGAFDGCSFAPYLDLGWEVHAFEPNPAYYEGLVRRFDSPAVTAHHCAIGDEPEEGRSFYASDEASAVASLQPFLSSHREIARVPVRTLRQVISEAGVERIDFLKIDAEGYDLPVLKGFPWESLRPSVVMCEFEDFKTHQVGYDTHDMGRFLLDRGYRVFLSEWLPIVRYGGAHRWRGVRVYPCSLLDPAAWGNFLAVLPEEMESMVASMLDVIVSDHEKQRIDADRREDSLGRTREALGQRNSMIQDLRAALARRDETIGRLGTELKNRDQKIQKIEAALERLQSATGAPPSDSRSES